MLKEAPLARRKALEKLLLLLYDEPLAATMMRPSSADNAAQTMAALYAIHSLAFE